MVKHFVLQWGACRGRELRLCVNWRGHRLTVAHSGALENIFCVLLLMEKEATGREMYLNLEEVMERSKILHGEGAAQLADDMLQQCRHGGGEHNVVDAEEQPRSGSASPENKQGSVRPGCNKAEREEVRGEPLVPRSWSLSQAIQRLVQKANMIWTRAVDEARWLLAIDSFPELAMQESVLDIQLVHRPSIGSCQREDSANGHRLDDWRERLIKIHSRSLMEAMHDLAGLAPLKSAVGIALVLEDPLASDDMSAPWPRNETPGAVPQQGVVLLLHRRAPGVVLQGSMH